MKTAVDLITLASKDAGVTGVGQSLSATDIADAMDTLGMLIGQLNAQRLMVYRLTDASCTGSGKTAFTVGPGGDFDMPRPNRIVSAYARMPNATGSLSVDFPLSIIDSREDYNRIALKSFVAPPSYVFYDPTLTMGTLYVYPGPSAGYQVTISAHQTIEKPLVPADVLTMPDAYWMLLRREMAKAFCLSYQVPVSSDLERATAHARDVVATMNLHVPLMQVGGPNSGNGLAEFLRGI